MQSSTLHPEVGQEGYNGWSWLLPFQVLEGSVVSEALIKLKQVMFYLNNFSIFRKTEFPFNFGWILCLFPCSKHKRFFLDIHCEKFVKLTEEWEILWWLGPSRVFNHQNCPHRAPRNLAITIRFSFLDCASHKDGSISCNSPY